MSVQYPLDMKAELETLEQGLGYIHALGVPFVGLDELFSVPPGAVELWALRGPEGFHPLMMNGWRQPRFAFTLLLVTLLGVWKGLEREAQEQATHRADLDTWVAFWLSFQADILSLGGLAPFLEEGCGGRVTPVPSGLVRSGGLLPGRVVEILKDYFPIYGVKTEDDLIALCRAYAEFGLVDRIGGRHEN